MTRLDVFRKYIHILLLTDLTAFLIHLALISPLHIAGSLTGSILSLTGYLNEGLTGITLSSIMICGLWTLSTPDADTKTDAKN